MPAWVYVGAGGFLGSVARWVLSGAVMKATGALFPLGTLAVNILGCFLIGFLMGLVEFRGIFAPEQRQFLVIGVLGGFTTFSSFSYETLALFRNGEHTLAGLNVLGNVVCCLVAVGLGWTLAKAMA